MSRVFGWIAFIAARYPIPVVSIFLIMSAASIISVLDLKLKLSFFDELPPDHPQVKRFRYVSENYGGTDIVFVVIEGEKISELKRCARFMENMLEESPLLKSVRGRLDVEFFKEHALYFLDMKDLSDFEDFIRRREVEFKKMAEDLRFPVFLANWSDMMEKEILEREAVGEDEEEKFVESIKNLREWLVSVSSALRGEIDYDSYKKRLRNIFFTGDEDYSADEEYIISEDEKILLITATPIISSDNIPFNRFLYDELLYMRKKAEPYCRSVKFAGMHVITAEEDIRIKKDMMFTSVIAYIGILLVFITIFRGILSISLIGISIITALCLVFGFIMLTKGYLTITASLFGPLLMGLGIDFSVYVLSRFGEESKKGLSPKDAAYNAVIHAAPPMSASAFTTAGAFFTLLIAEHRGTKLISFVAGSGLIIFLLTMISFLPALLVLVGKYLGREKALELRWLGGVSELIQRRPFPFFSVFILLFGVGIFGTIKLAYEYSLMNLVPKLPAIEAENILVERFGRGKDYSIVIAKDLEDTRIKVRKLEKLETVGKIESIADFIPEDIPAKRPLVGNVNKIIGNMRVGDISYDSPSSEDIAQSFEQMKRVAKALLQLAILSGSFDGEDESRLLMRDIDRLIKFVEGNSNLRTEHLDRINAKALKEFLEDMKKASFSEGFKLADLPDDIRRHYIGKDGSFIIFAYPKRRIWEDERYMRKNSEEVKTVDPSAFGMGSLALSVTDRIKLDFKRAMKFTVVVVIFLVFITFRRISFTIFALLPVFLGVFFTASFMGLSGTKIHYMNMGALSIVIGAGIDYGIHILHRIMEEKGNIPLAVQTTGKAILIASVTTAVGFGSIMFATFPGLRDYGQVLAFGVLSCLICAIFAMTSIISLLKKLGFKT